MEEVKTALISNSVFDLQTEPVLYLEDNIESKTYYKYNPQTNSNSSLTWSFQSPGYGLVLDPNVMVSSGINATITCTGVPIGDTCFQYANTDCIQSFPFNRTINVASCKINDSNSDISTQFILDELLRSCDPKHLAKYADTTAVKSDTLWGLFSQGVNTNSNVLASSANTGYDKWDKPRGAGNLITFLQIDRFNNTGVFQDNSPISTATTNVFVISIQIQVSEPLIGLPPFHWEGSHYKSGGIMGINNFSVNLVTDTTLSRFFSTANTTTGASALTSYITGIQMGLNPNAGGTAIINTSGAGITSYGFSNPQLLMTYYTPNAQQLKKIGSTVNYHAYQDYSQRNTTTLTQIATGATTTVTSNSIQLFSIPTRMYVFVRLPVTTSNYWNYTKSYLKINGISITFGNNSGLLSSANTYQLYEMSKKNGSTQTWDEFSGDAFINNAGSGGVTRVPTIGSLLVIDPARDLGISLSQSNNSLGQYNLQISVGITNQFPFAITPELIILPEVDGYIKFDSGTSTKTLANVTQQIVLETKDSAPTITDGAFERMSGGSKLAKVGVIRRLLQKMKGVKKHGGDVVGAGYLGGGSSNNRLSKLKNLC
jgi:hypothetical protein